MRSFRIRRGLAGGKVDRIKGREKGAVTVSTCSVRCCLVFLVTTEEELSTLQARDHLRAASTSSPSNYQQPLHTFSLFCVLCMKINIFHLLYLQRRCYYNKLKVTNVYLTSGEQMYVDLDILDIFLHKCTVISLLFTET